MSESAKNIIDWLLTLPPEQAVAVESGGLALVAVGRLKKGQPRPYYDIGGAPDNVRTDDVGK